MRWGERVDTIRLPDSTKRTDENPRVPGKRNPAQVRRRDAARRSLLFGRRGGEGRARARRQGLGGESADPRRRPRQGRRREGRQVRGRSARVGRKNTRDDAEDASNRTRGPESQEAPDRGGRRYQEGALPRHG